MEKEEVNFPTAREDNMYTQAMEEEIRPSFEKLKDPYIYFLEGDWERFVQFFRKDPSALTEWFSSHLIAKTGGTYKN